ncbi:hypothetical protein QEJ31_00105 [Pigmentibacter sp. JX0631]|uniref:hypothetical protein n=1 Tax=Pigmentibacter sp. JX0631 TaxID=2976982 RepID=UPI00246974B9|nr:hypothetical protein [Pigmentibacter sp. JX0631]WGL60004.1 hypothetical protein QEJ31_00105 [Pigmentibacter sp. JX0631]
MQKNLPKTISKPFKNEKSKYLVSLIIYLISALTVTWAIQLYASGKVTSGNPLFILIALILSTWLPFFISLMIALFFKIPLYYLALMPRLNKKLFWAIIVPLLTAAIGLQFSINFSQIFYQESNEVLFLSGNTVYSILHLFLVHPLSIIFFTCIYAIGLEVQFRGILIELFKKIGIANGWFLAGAFQFFCFLPFLWFGYFGGGASNTFYCLLFAILFVGQSGFCFWLSTFHKFMTKDKIGINTKVESMRSLLVPMIYSCVFYFIYFFIVIKFFIENGNMWMSGPANGITVMIQSFITIFLLMTKRLKH